MTAAPRIFDRPLYCARLARARASGPDILNRTLAAETLDRLSLINRSFSRACLIAPDPHAVAETLAATGRITVIKAMTPSADEGFGFDEGAYDAIINLADLQAVIRDFEADFKKGQPGALDRARPVLQSVWARTRAELRAAIAPGTAS